MIINDSTCGVTFLFECAKKSWFCSEYKMDIDMDLIVSILECSNKTEQASEDLSKAWLGLNSNTMVYKIIFMNDLGYMQSIK